MNWLRSIHIFHKEPITCIFNSIASYQNSLILIFNWERLFLEDVCHFLNWIFFLCIWKIVKNICMWDSFQSKSVINISCDALDLIIWYSLYKLFVATWNFLHTKLNKSFLPYFNSSLMLISQFLQLLFKVLDCILLFFLNKTEFNLQTFKFGKFLAFLILQLF